MRVPLVGEERHIPGGFGPARALCCRGAKGIRLRGMGGPQRLSHLF